MIAKVTLAAPAEGGCLCGAVRYWIEPCEGDSAYCHSLRRNIISGA
jgi:hypothetical protein